MDTSEALCCCYSSSNSKDSFAHRLDIALLILTLDNCSGSLTVRVDRLVVLDNRRRLLLDTFDRKLTSEEDRGMDPEEVRMDGSDVLVGPAKLKVEEREALEMMLVNRGSRDRRGEARLDAQ